MAACIKKSAFILPYPNSYPESITHMYPLYLSNLFLSIYVIILEFTIFIYTLKFILCTDVIVFFMYTDIDFKSAIK